MLQNLSLVEGLAADAGDDLCVEMEGVNVLEDCMMLELQFL
jgi:hypothetical protein